MKDKPGLIIVGCAIIISIASACIPTLSSAFITTGTVITSPGNPGTIGFSTNYTIRVKVWDAEDQESAWSAPYGYATKPGPWPEVDFAYAPSKPAAKQPIQFTDQTLNGPIAWSWSFSDGGISAEQHPVYTFNAEGSYSVTLQATNTAGTCSTTKALGITKPIPTYREVRPGQESSEN
jgi:PKD repeat protein